MESEDKTATGDTVTERQARPDPAAGRGCCSPRRPDHRDLRRRARRGLLLGGDMEWPAFIRPAFDALARTLPHNRWVRFPGLDHGGSTDVGPTNRGGKPDVVAPATGPSSPSHDPQPSAGSCGPAAEGHLQEGRRSSAACRRSCWQEQPGHTTPISLWDTIPALPGGNVGQLADGGLGAAIGRADPQPGDPDAASCQTRRRTDLPPPPPSAAPWPGCDGRSRC